MSETTDPKVLRTAVQVDGRAANYSTADRDGPVALLLHGTYWSRVWLPMLDGLAEAGLRPIAVDLPGLVCSDGELDIEIAAVPVLADWVGDSYPRYRSPDRSLSPVMTSAVPSPSTSSFTMAWR
jgi:pimeloyl-ACP methyl ester carboxylesterase